MGVKAEVKNRCVIIAGGDFDAAERSVITPDDYVIAADSGYAVCIEYDIVPDLIVGDFDSFKGSLPDGIETIHLPTHKDDTDLLFAARCAADKGYRSVAILGGYGSRPDQNFAMYETLLWFKENVPGSDACAFCRGFYVTVLLNDSKRIFVGSNRYLSVFSLYEKATGVDITGTGYPLENGVITAGFPIGVSNCADGYADISVKNGALLVMVVYEFI